MPRWRMVRDSMEGVMEGEMMVEMEREWWNWRRRTSQVACERASVEIFNSGSSYARLLRASGAALLQPPSPSHPNLAPLRIPFRSLRDPSRRQCPRYTAEPARRAR